MERRRGGRRRERPQLVSGEARCIECGCTDSRACPGGCGWVVLRRELGAGWCSRCAAEVGVARAVPSAHPIDFRGCTFARPPGLRGHRPGAPHVTGEAARRATSALAEDLMRAAARPYQTPLARARRWLVGRHARRTAFASVLAVAYDWPRWRRALCYLGVWW